MDVNLAPIIKTYIDASNAHDVKSVLNCFSDDAVVRDEGQALRGKIAIAGWIARTIEKYKFQFKSLRSRNEDGTIVVAIEVSGTFDGSPVTLDYHFTIAGDRILSLAIE